MYYIYKKNLQKKYIYKNILKNLVIVPKMVEGVHSNHYYRGFEEHAQRRRFPMSFLVKTKV